MRERETDRQGQTDRDREKEREIQRERDREREPHTVLRASCMASGIFFISFTESVTVRIINKLKL